jgi:hypothetical protein
MSYEAVSIPVRRRLGRPMGGMGTGFDPSTVWGFYLIPGTIGLFGLWLIARIFAPRGE